MCAIASDTSESPASGSTAVFATFLVILLGVGAVGTLLPPEELALPPVRTVLAISFALPTVLMFILAAMPHSVAVTLVPPLAEMPFDALLDSARIQAGRPPESEAIERAEMRSEERSAGKGGVSTWRSRRVPYNSKKKNRTKHKNK